MQHIQYRNMKGETAIDEVIQNRINQIGDRIYMFRTEKGISEDALAKELGIATNSLYEYEMGRKHLTLVQLLTCCEVLDIQMNDLYIHPYHEPSDERYEALVIKTFRTLSKEEKHDVATYITVKYLTALHNHGPERK